MSKRKCVSMGHLDEDSLICDVGNGVSMSDDEECLEKRANTSSIQDAVKVLLTALGEDINREGIIKTPLRVAKALSEGTREAQVRVHEESFLTKRRALGVHLESFPKSKRLR
ncbi:hypothetical protein VIGAN_09046200 [Vigna angularis var. angularis]|uniref:GTP cyclohydrolase 1 n=1 Tax=Vigna angularis var. angularis TaxID=157739 RepID=A0A0S3SWN4_PHAAN|nr:hypothetical protein VIGAN_09046200 [Vigna angularis var. angularis]